MNNTEKRILMALSYGYSLKSLSRKYGARNAKVAHKKLKERAQHKTRTFAISYATLLITH